MFSYNRFILFLLEWFVEKWNTNKNVFPVTEESNSQKTGCSKNDTRPGPEYIFKMSVNHGKVSNSMQFYLTIDDQD